MNSYIPLNLDRFLELLRVAYATGDWTVTLEERGCIRLRRKDCGMIFDPLTAVFHHLTGREIYRGFLVEELSNQFGFPWWEINEVAYATIKLITEGKHYDIYLRNKLLSALGLPEEPIKRWELEPPYW